MIPFVFYKSADITGVFSLTLLPSVHGYTVKMLLFQKKKVAERTEKNELESEPLVKKE